MTEFVINYLNTADNNVLLATEKSSGVDVKELPFDPEQQNVFIRKVFSQSSTGYWKVIKIDVVDDTNNMATKCDIYVEPVPVQPRSIAEKHGSNGSKLLRGRLMECDFGYFSQEISVGNPPITTVGNMNSKLPYEMVKRRLVVVVSTKEDPALVVPLSKARKAKDSRTVVEITSLPDNLVTFTEPVCYAKAASVSLVSGHRLFPLRYHEGEKKKYDNKVEKKLSNDDVVAIKKAIFVAVGGANIMSSGEQKEREVETLLEDQIELQRQLEELKQKNNELEDMLDRFTQG